MTERYRMFAGYNAWANRRLYDAAARLDDAEYRADRGLFFGSVHRTLNHLLLVDRLWRTRLTGEGEVPARVDLALYEDLASLHRGREETDAWLAGFVEMLTPEALDATMRWSRVVDAMVVAQPFWAVLDHIFNHHAHHRGQVHAALTGIRGADFAPSLDLPLFQRESGLGWRDA